EAAAAAPPGLSVAAAAAAAGGAACVAAAGAAPRVEKPLPGTKYQNAPPTTAVAATAAPINTRFGFCAPSSSSVDAPRGRKAPMVRGTSAAPARSAAPALPCAAWAIAASSTA